MPLYHFSEDPSIASFAPRVPEHRQGEVEAFVWAIDAWHAPMYFFPRDCPRILLWALPSTTEADRQRWFGASEARMLAHIEWDWLERVRSASLYRYAFDEAPFEDLHDAGMHVSRETLEPVGVEAVGPLLEAQRAAGVELRVMESLTPLRGVWDTSLHASGIRLRNAKGWNA
ncbi:MAG: hypothetical protein R3C39_05615 [Dehalococcoidia bacterium]